jgi:hypothetical protein
MENYHAINGKIHYEWPFSIAMLLNDQWLFEYFVQSWPEKRFQCFLVQSCSALWVCHKSICCTQDMSSPTTAVTTPTSAITGQGIFESCWLLNALHFRSDVLGKPSRPRHSLHSPFFATVPRQFLGSITHSGQNQIRYIYMYICIFY